MELIFRNGTHLFLLTFIEITHSSIDYLGIASLWLSFLGYVLNPMLYGLLNRNLRKQVICLLKISPSGNPRSPFIVAILRRSATFRSSNSNLSRLSVSPIFSKNTKLQVRLVLLDVRVLSDNDFVKPLSLSIS